MEKKIQKSLLEQIIEFVNANEKFTIQQIFEITNAPKNQIYTALWKLGKRGMVNKVGVGQYERLALTPVNKSAKKRKTKKVKAKVPTVGIEKLKLELEHATQEIIYWRKLAKDTEAMQTHIKGLEHDLKEALVLIRYLENKLFVAIQYDARTNGNT